MGEEGPLKASPADKPKELELTHGKSARFRGAGRVPGKEKSESSEKQKHTQDSTLTLEAFSALSFRTTSP